MARRAQQGSVARCPYCEAFLPQVATECPQCRFPLTMAAADVGFRSPEHSGTSSTATPGGRTAIPVLAGHGDAAARAKFHGTRAHRIRVTAWVLAVTSILLLIAGVGALVTAASPDAAGDAKAKISLVSTRRRAITPEPRDPPAPGLVEVTADVPSDGPGKVSTDRSDGVWFGAAKSTSGTCFFLAGSLSAEKDVVGVGSLADKDPCTGGEVHRRYDRRKTGKKT